MNAATRLVARVLGSGQQVRTKSRLVRAEGGVKHFGFTYYPRFPDQKDPPLEVSKLLYLRRVKPFWGRPYWEKQILKELGLLGKTSDVAIVKNIPEINQRIWHVKHLLLIQPIRCPDGLPEDGDLSGTFLQENGVFRVATKLKVAPESVKALEDFRSQKTRLDGETLRRHLRLKWVNPW